MTLTSRNKQKTRKRVYIMTENFPFTLRNDLMIY